MKEGWTYKKLGEVCEVVGGGTPDTKVKEYWRGNIPWATVSDMKCDDLKTTGYFITDKGLKESSSRIIKSGEIIIATRVGLGKVCKLAVDTAINQDLKGIIPKNDDILRNFIFYYFKQKAKYIIDNGVGATVKGVKIKFIEELSFGYPPLSEQQAIVSRLDAAFAHIDELKANAEKQLSEARKLFQAELTECMRLKEGWEEKKLGDVSTFQNGFAFKSNLFKNTGLPIIRISNIQNEGIQTDDIVFFDKKDYPVNFDNYRIFPNDILIAMSGGTTGKLGINDTNTIFYQNQRVGVIREISKYLDHRFLFYFLHTKSEESLKIAAGAAQPNLSTAQIKGFGIPVPALDVQQKIVDRLDALSANIKRLEEVQRKTIAECDALKQAMLREVFE